MLIDHIKTDRFSIGCLGRSGSRTIADFLSGYYSTLVPFAARTRFLYDLNNISTIERDIVLKSIQADKFLFQLVKDGFFPHHRITQTSIEDFNNYDAPNKILVLRHPLERAKSGSDIKLEPTFHGMPCLSSIDFEEVDYIIDFNELSEYTNRLHLGSYAYDKQTAEEIDSHDINSDLFDIGASTKDWHPSDYDYEEEVKIYNDLLETKERLPLDLWKNLTRNISEMNLPSMFTGIRYRK